MEMLRQTIRPEFLNRVDEIVLFKPLTLGEITKIVELLLGLLRLRLADRHIELELSDAAKEHIAREGAQGVGLYRTEFLYLNRRDLPSEEEQAADYARVIAGAGPEGAIIRTLDIGGDKLHHLHHGLEESNPFLGWRGIRVSLARPEIFRIQIRAILQIGRAHV